jgi:hypothetical protein
MRRLVGSIVALLCAAPPSALAGQKQKPGETRGKAPAALSEEEREILKNRELLENLDLLRNLDKVKYIDFLADRKQDKGKETPPPKGKDDATKKPR